MVKSPIWWFGLSRVVRFWLFLLCPSELGGRLLGSRVDFGRWPKRSGGQRQSAAGQRILGRPADEMSGGARLILGISSIGEAAEHLVFS